MSITSVRTAEGEITCIATQTQALIIGIEKSRKLPKSLTSFLKTTNCVWIIDSTWKSLLRGLISKDRLVDWKTLPSKTKDSRRITDLLELWKWPKLRIPEERGDQWMSLSPNKEQIEWIAFSTWAKVTAAWTAWFPA